MTGILPETDFPELVTFATTEEREYGNDYIYSVNTGDAVIALSTVGIVETEARLATRLVTLGALSTVDGPLPVADLVCLVIGISLLWHHTATKLSMTTTAVLNQIGPYYGATAKANAQNVQIGAAVVTAKIRQGFNHFEAFRNNVKPGGILLGVELTFALASERLKKNGDVWSIQKSSAKAISANISFGSSPDEDPAHISNGFFMNRPHFHARVLGVRTGGHSFW
ncbi:hypothetical protein [Paenibacillus sp. MY03]|uniref:hypothetical protein n=1 Tax=Paenibacillus sp. MY03 TaxID=302980 RepID=UPI00117D375A|nr:hypothetical protein [Paenibacillus sp. MY03]